MSWTDFPPSTLQPFSKYYWAKQPYKSTQEKAWAAGAPAWPPPTFRWLSGGTVSSVTNNNDGTYAIGIGGATLTASRWYNFSRPTGDTTTPQFYDLIIDAPFDETTCMHLQIQGNTTSAFTVTDTPIADALTSNFLSATSTLVGRKFYVIRRGGLWWHDRWIDFPNDRESAQGLSLVAGAILSVTSLTSSGTTATATVTAHGFTTGDSVTIAGALSGYNGVKTIAVTGANTFTYTVASGLTTPSTGTITATNPLVGANDPSASFTAGAFATGYELMVTGSDGYWKRITLTGNDATNLLFARNTFTVSGQYAVVAAGNKCRKINSDCRPHAGYIPRWYDSANPGGAPISPFLTYFTQSPVDGSIGATRLPTRTISLLGGTSCGTPITEAVFDTDFQTEHDDGCNTPDANYTPEIYKGLRGLQVAMENLCTFYVNKNSTYEGAGAIPLFVPATWFKAAGIGLSWTTTTGSLDNTGGTGGIDFSTVGSLPYTPIDVYYAILDFQGTPITFGQGNCDRDGHLNKISGSFAAGDTGQTLVIATGWTRIFERTFMYLYDKTCWVPDVVSGSVVDPPTSAHPGTWSTQPFSFTPRAKSTKYREVSDIGIINDAFGRDSFVTGDYARYEGDNSNDPNIHPETLTTDTTGVMSYYRNYFEGTLPPTPQAARVASRSITVTAATRYQVSDSSKNWWPGGSVAIASSTFTSGSTTNGADSAFTSDGRWGAFLKFKQTVQITIGGVVYRRPIDLDLIAGNMGWSEPLPASASGKSYVYLWPKYESNMWQGRDVEFTFPDGSVHTFTVQENDDQTLFFGSDIGIDIPIGSTGLIKEEYPGGVWKWDGSKWVVPTGNDPRTGVAWHTNQRENHPYTMKRYGRCRKFDIAEKTFWTEIYNGLQQLMWVKWHVDWTSKSETNQASPPESTGQLSLSAAQSNATGNWSSYQTSFSGQPYAVAYTDFNCFCYSYGISRRYGYGVVTGVIPYQSCAVDYYAKAEIPTNLDGTSSSTSLQNFSCTPKTIFDDEGDGVLLNAWHKWDTQTISSGSATSGRLGSLSIPNAIGPAPAVCPSPGFCAEWSGYTITDVCAILRFNVSGGFVQQ